MRYSSTVQLSVGPAVVYPFVFNLSRYVEWMPMVHAVEEVSDDVWVVELRAKVGVFARSKRLRMRRTVTSPSTLVFERDEIDGRKHSPWVMTVLMAPTESGSAVTIDLSYGGTLWTAGVLDRVLASQVEAGKAALARVAYGA